MSDADQDQKTEEPTGKRLDEAREHGQIPVSRETAMWVSLLGILGIMMMVFPMMVRNLADFLRQFIESPHQIRLDEDSIQPLFFYVFANLSMSTGIVFLLIMAAIIAGYMLQTGFFFSLDLMVPDFMRLSPSRGLQRLFSVSALVELGKSLGKMILLGAMAYSILLPIAYESPQFTGLPLEEIIAFTYEHILRLIRMLLLVFLVIAAADMFYTRFQYYRNLRMTKVEVKDEMKQQEGDPMIKGRLRQMRIERARKRMMAQVPKADVVITNPTHYAVALKYELKKMSAPIVLAKGINLIAERIREIAEENNVPLVSNPPLARALFDTVEIDQQIPGEHYRAVAEVISYVFKLKKRKF